MPDNDARRRQAKDPQVVSTTSAPPRPPMSASSPPYSSARRPGHWAKLSVKVALLESITLDPSQSSQEDHREVALILFCPLTETIGPISQSHLAYLQPILLKRLQDGTSIHVRVAALKCVIYFVYIYMYHLILLK
uniref:Uncharacterized protein LOC105048730 isoform X2 n=1 Tax=Elaeis guineensis var. tenera TaxID=51953 RepID=A0A6I9RH62_ELAGV|nr:uncharacterized protein LOC105048730 isoform X2 [Elaeis guineensis]